MLPVATLCRCFGCFLEYGAPVGGGATESDTVPSISGMDCDWFLRFRLFLRGPCAVEAVRFLPGVPVWPGGSGDPDVLVAIGSKENERVKQRRCIRCSSEEAGRFAAAQAEGYLGDGAYRQGGICGILRSVVLVDFKVDICEIVIFRS